MAPAGWAVMASSAGGNESSTVSMYGRTTVAKPFKEGGHRCPNEGGRGSALLGQNTRSCSFLAAELNNLHETATHRVQRLQRVVL